jgi:hypothetical protein
VAFSTWCSQSACVTDPETRLTCQVCGGTMTRTAGVWAHAGDDVGWQDGMLVIISDSADHEAVLDVIEVNYTEET